MKTSSEVSATVLEPVWIEKDKSFCPSLTKPWTFPKCVQALGSKLVVLVETGEGTFLTVTRNALVMMIATVNVLPASHLFLT